MQFERTLRDSLVDRSRSDGMGAGKDGLAVAAERGAVSLRAARDVRDAY
jgi:hypothetical protein